MITTELLYLDDLEPGARFSSGEYEVSEPEITRFARQYDPQPFHTDAEAAKRTFFGGLAASGWHTAAITMRLLTDGGLPSQAASSAPAGSSPGPHRCGRDPRCASKARSSK